MNGFEKPGVYSIPCKDCNNIYVGQTGRQISTRLHEHFNSTKPNSSISSAVKDHVKICKHHIDFDNSRVILHSNSLSDRLFIETYYIKRSNVFPGNKGSIELLLY